MKKSKISSIVLSAMLVTGVLAGAYGVSFATHQLSPYTALHANLATATGQSVIYKGITQYVNGAFVGVGGSPATVNGPGKDGALLSLNNGGAIDNDTCVFCHGNKKVESSPIMGMGEPIVSAHKKHFFSVLLLLYRNSTDGTDNQQGCTFCHQKAATGYEGDLSYNMTGSYTQEIRKQVDPDTCIRCHGTFVADVSAAGKGQAHYADSVAASGATVADANPRGCVGCHKTDGTGIAMSPNAGHTAMTGVPEDTPNAARFINQRYSESGTYCLICHGGKAWFLVNETN